MKTHTLISLLLLVAGLRAGKAQNAVLQAGPSVLVIPDVRNPLIFKGFSAYYSRGLNRRFSLGLNTVLGLPTTTLGLSGTLYVNTTYFQPELRWYSRRMLYGFYMGGGLNVQDYRVRQRINGRNVELANRTQFGAAFVFGYQQPFRRHWSAYFSAALNWSRVFLGPGESNPNGIGIFAGFGVGYLLYPQAEGQR